MILEKNFSRKVSLFICYVNEYKAIDKSTNHRMISLSNFYWYTLIMYRNDNILCYYVNRAMLNVCWSLILITNWY